MQTIDFLLHEENIHRPLLGRSDKQERSKPVAGVRIGPVFFVGMAATANEIKLKKQKKYFT